GWWWGSGAYGGRGVGVLSPPLMLPGMIVLRTTPLASIVPPHAVAHFCPVTDAPEKETPANSIDAPRAEPNTKLLKLRAPLNVIALPAPMGLYVDPWFT